MKRTQNAIYLPPALPEYLKNVYDLKPIVGSPNNDEIKGIQTVIQAAQNATQIPRMFNPELSMGLAQHLFEVQMAMYWEKYPCSMFPDDMVHTPLTLPSHITFTLEPVVGVPSDEELQAAQAAVRGYEQMAIFPSMLDPTISMELSQHLFNIHLDIGSELSDEAAPEVSNEPNISHPVTAYQAAPPPQTESTTGIALLQAKVAESNDRLAKISDTLAGVKQVLIQTQQNYAMSTYSPHDSIRGCQTEHLETMNDKGQFPTAQGLPLLTRGTYGLPLMSHLSNEHLAQYLHFYNLGGDLLRPGDTSTLQDNRRSNAENRLSNYINNRIRPA